MTQAACRGVARVGEGFFSLFPRPLVEFFKTLFRHEDLTPHFQNFRPVLSPQAQGNGANGAHVGGYVLAPVAITPGGALHQAAIFVTQADGQAIQLGLGAVGHLFHPKKLAHPFVEIRQFPVAEGVAQGQHGDLVTHLGKFLEGFSPHSLGGRVRRDQLGVGGFQFLEFAQQAIVLAVRYFWIVEDVIAIVVVVDLLAQVTDPRFHIPVVHLCSLARRSLRRCSMMASRVCCMVCLLSTLWVSSCSTPPRMPASSLAA